MKMENILEEGPVSPPLTPVLSVTIQSRDSEVSSAKKRGKIQKSVSYRDRTASTKVVRNFSGRTDPHKAQPRKSLDDTTQNGLLNPDVSHDKCHQDNSNVDQSTSLQSNKSHWKTIQPDTSHSPTQQSEDLSSTTLLDDNTGAKGAQGDSVHPSQPQRDRSNSAPVQRDMSHSKPPHPDVAQFHSSCGPPMSRRQSAAVLAQTQTIVAAQELLLAQREKEKSELKSRVAELEEYQGKYDQEKKENQILQNRLQELMAGQSDATKNLMKTNEAFDRLRLDHKKKVEQIEKMQRDISFKDDRIRNLEIRASEVEKAELILETTKQNLESTGNTVKMRDAEIKKLNKDVEDCNRQIETLQRTISDMDEKMEDMKIQVRYEIMKNENIEKNLETIPRLKDTIQERETEIHNLKKHIEEKNALLAAARKAVREYKDKVRSTEQQLSETEALREDLQLSNFEILTLKKLMTGKDYLVSQKSKALDLSKEIISVLNDTMENDHVDRIQHLIDRLGGPEHPSRTSSSRSNGYGTASCTSDHDYRASSAPPPRFRSSTPGPGQGQTYLRDIDINHHPYGLDSVDGPGSEHAHNNSCSYPNANNNNKRILHQVIQDTHDNRKRPVSAMPFSGSRKMQNSRTTSFREAQKVYTKPLPRKPFDHEAAQSPRQHVSHVRSDKPGSAKLKPSVDYSHSLVLEDVNNNEKVKNSETDSVTSGSDLDEDLTTGGEDELRGLNARDKDDLLEEIIKVGDRVLISCPQKPPKYGKKRVLKPINYTGIVKYKGKLNPEKYDARIHVGVRMDEQVGDTDGMYKGKRLMYTPGDQGKFFKIRDLTSVLNVKSGSYIPIKRLMVHYLHKLERSKTKEEH